MEPSDNQELERVDFEGHPFWLRKGNYGDEYVLKENIIGNQYKNVKINQNDIILDIGAHIGTFTVDAALSAGKVIAVEMDSSNFALLKKNTQIYDNIIIINKACVSQDCTLSKVEYYPGTRNSGATSMYIKKGRQGPFSADTITITELLSKYHPTIIKCDTEGAEYDIFNSLVVPDSVKQIAMEFHFGHKEWRDKANEIQASLIKQGFTVPVAHDYTSNKNWIMVQFFKRSKGLSR